MTVSIAANKPFIEKRRKARSNHPLQISFGGQKLVADNWNEEGFKISSQHTGAFNADLQTVRVSIPVGKDNFSFDADIIKRWSTRQANTAGFQFIGMPNPKRALLTSFKKTVIDNYCAKPSMLNNLEDNLVKQQLPVKEAPSESALPRSVEPAANDNGLSNKGIGMSIFYVLLGLIVSWFVFSSLYSQLFRLNIETAVITRPVEKLSSPIDGTITDIFHAEGSTVAGNETVLAITNSNNQRTITQAEIQLDEAKLDLKIAINELQSGQKALEVYQQLAQTQLQAAQSKTSNSADTLRLATEELNRARELYQQRVISSMEYDESKTLFNRAKSEMAEADAEVQNAQQLNEQIRSGHYFSEQRMEIDQDHLISNRDIAAQRVQLAQRRLDAARTKSEYVLKAPYPAQIISLTKSAGSFATMGEQLIILEKLESPVVDAYLTRKEVSKISKGSQANVYIPALDQTVDAEVISIDRTARFTNAETIRFSWQDSEERTSRVTLELIGENTLASHKQALTGLPAHVSFTTTKRP